MNTNKQRLFWVLVCLLPCAALADGFSGVWSGAMSQGGNNYALAVATRHCHQQRSDRLRRLVRRRKLRHVWARLSSALLVFLAECENRRDGRRAPWPSSPRRR